MMAFNIADILSRKRLDPPMKSFLWRIVLPDLLNKAYINVGQVGVGDGVDNAINILNARDRQYHLEVSSRVSNVTIPFNTFDTERAPQQNSFWYYAKHNDIGTITIECNEYEDGLTFRYFEAWRNMIVNSDGTYNAPNVYKQNIDFYRLSATHEDLIKHSFKNYFISTIADQTNDYEGNEIVRWSITLTGDSIETTILPLASLREKPDEIELLNQTISYDKDLDDLSSVIANALS